MKFVRKISFMLVGCFGLLGAASCSVKEIRDDCPIYVTVLTDRFRDLGFDRSSIFFKDPDQDLMVDVDNFAIAGKGYLQPLSREYARVSVLGGVDREVFEGDQMRVPYGFESGPIWAYTESFTRNEDLYTVDSVPHKQFCKVQFMFGSSRHAPDNYRWRFRILADCNGMNLFTLDPLPGAYCCPVGPNAVGEWYAIIPRQVNSTMIMEIFVPNENSFIEGETEYIIDLGEKFKALGYDWTKEDLDDVSVRVNFSSPEVLVEVSIWEDDYSYSKIEI